MLLKYQNLVRFCAKLLKKNTMDIIVLLLDMVLMTFCRLESKTAKCDGKFELSGLNHGHLEQGIKNHAIVGHSFKNFTLPKIYDCHIQCFDEKCKCQAFQISGDRCELLDEDRYSTPDEFIYTPGYAYFDMSREYIHQVRVICLLDTNISLIRNAGLSHFYFF